MKKLLLPALVSLSLAGSMMFATPALAERDRHDRVERGEHRDRYQGHRDVIRNNHRSRDHSVHRKLDRHYHRGNHNGNRYYYNSHRPKHSYRSGRHYQKRHNDGYYNRYDDRRRHGSDVIRLIGGAIILDELIRHH